MFCPVCRPCELLITAHGHAWEISSLPEASSALKHWQEDAGWELSLDTQHHSSECSTVRYCFDINAQHLALGSERPLSFVAKEEINVATSTRYAAGERVDWASFFHIVLYTSKLQKCWFTHDCFILSVWSVSHAARPRGWQMNIVFNSIRL